MAVCSVGTTKYEADIGRLMERRLDRLGGGISPECGRGFAEASIEGGAQLAQWCEAVAELLLMDLSQFEIAAPYAGGKKGCAARGHMHGKAGLRPGKIAGGADGLL